ncbi:uncharacterized protein LOC144456732 isoform X2 [Phascolarctos cinereus]
MCLRRVEVRHCREDFWRAGRGPAQLYGLRNGGPAGARLRSGAGRGRGVLPPQWNGQPRGGKRRSNQVMLPALRVLKSLAVFQCIYSVAQVLPTIPWRSTLAILHSSQEKRAHHLRRREMRPVKEARANLYCQILLKHWTQSMQEALNLPPRTLTLDVVSSPECTPCVSLGIKTVCTSLGNDKGKQNPCNKYAVQQNKPGWSCLRQMEPIYKSRSTRSRKGLHGRPQFLQRLGRCPSPIMALVGMVEAPLSNFSLALA